MEQTKFLEGINRKKEKAWEELYRYYYAALCCYAEKLLGGTGGAEDIVQECMIRMWNMRLEFSELRALTAWLYKSVYHATVSALRKQKSQNYLHENWSAEQTEDEEYARKMALREEAISCFYDVLYKMPRQQRDILIYSLKGLRVQEIAEMMQISENSVKTHKKRAYLFVREHYDVSFLQILIAFFFRVDKNSL